MFAKAMNASAAVLAVGVVSSIVASTLSSWSGTSIGAVSAQRRIDIVPRGGAFVIWFPIYVLLIAAAVYAAFHDDVPFTPSALTALAEVLTGVWVPLFLTNTRWSLTAAACVLVAAAASACAAVATAGPLVGEEGSSWVRAACVGGAFALFAGWLLCAATLGVGIALQTYGVETPQWSLLVLAATAALCAAATRNPVVAAPCVWALLWQQTPGTSIGVAGMLTCAAGGLAALRPHA